MSMIVEASWSNCFAGQRMDIDIVKGVLSSMRPLGFSEKEPPPDESCEKVDCRPKRERRSSTRGEARKSAGLIVSLALHSWKKKKETKDNEQEAGADI